MLRLGFYVIFRIKAALCLGVEDLWRLVQAPYKKKHLAEIKSFNNLLIYPFKISDLDQYIREHPGELSDCLLILKSGNRSETKKMMDVNKAGAALLKAVILLGGVFCSKAILLDLLVPITGIK